VPLALAASCGNDETRDLFQKSRSPTAGGFDPTSLGNSGSGGGGRSAAAGAGGTKTMSPPKATGGRDADGGAPSGGRAVTGGRSGGRNGGSVGGRRATGGTQNGGRAPSGGLGGEPSGGVADGGNGGEPAVDCDDGDECAVDEATDAGCGHAPALDETACNDDDECTSDDACHGGQCVGRDEANASDDDSRPIPDGNGTCDNTEASLVDYTMTGPGHVSEVEVTVTLSHPWITDLRLALLHVETEAFVVLVEEQLQQGATLDGTYVFADDAESFADAVPVNAPVPSGRYAPRGSFLETFGGSPVAGTWRLVVLDECQGDTGVLHASAVHFHRACGGD